MAATAKEIADMIDRLRATYAATSTAFVMLNDAQILQLLAAKGYDSGSTIRLGRRDNTYHEGITLWNSIASLSVMTMVLKYRVPRRPGQVEELPAPGPLQDAQRALSLVRSQATEWGIDPRRIGMIGFSAGAHLTGAAATQFDQRTYAPLDPIDKASCRPDFAILAYPGYLVVKDTEVLAPYIRIPAEAPPFFLVHAADDSVAPVTHSVVMYLALRRAGIPAELHVYAAGGHGFGVRPSERPVSTWPARCAEWLRELGVLKASAGR